VVSLATHVAEPLERLDTIARGARLAKDQDVALGPGLLARWAELAAPASLARVAARAIGAVTAVRPPFNVVVSNLAGSPVPLYAAGAQMLALYPLGPVVAGVGLNITIASYRDTIHAGLLADADAVPDPDDIAEGLHDAL